MVRAFFKGTFRTPIISEKEIVFIFTAISFTLGKKTSVTVALYGKSDPTDVDWPLVGAGGANVVGSFPRNWRSFPVRSVHASAIDVHGFGRRTPRCPRGERDEHVPGNGSLVRRWGPTVFTVP